MAIGENGGLPHEFLPRVPGAEEINGTKPTFEQTIEAAKAAVPYFAPKLATRTLQGPTGGAILIGRVETTDKKVIEAELDALVAGDASLAELLQSIVGSVRYHETPGCPQGMGRRNAHVACSGRVASGSVSAPRSRQGRWARRPRDLWRP